jgi:DNA-binding response OmpR family regulator
MRILLVDDEPPLVRLLETFLCRRGYEVDACMKPAAALDLFRASPKRYALVLADVTMPEMSGDELVLRIAALSDTVRILLTSGLPFDIDRFPENIRRRTCFLQKPFLPNMVTEMIGRLVGDGGDRPGTASTPAG